MFDFLDEDWFIITLEIVFVVLIAYDIKQYVKTKKKEYITNTVLTLAFAIWALMPMYSKYMTWSEQQRGVLSGFIDKEHNNVELSNCITDTIFKSYTHKEYRTLNKKSKEYTELMKETKEDCLDDSWF